MHGQAEHACRDFLMSRTRAAFPALFVGGSDARIDRCAFYNIVFLGANYYIDITTQYLLREGCSIFAQVAIDLFISNYKHLLETDE